MRVPWTARRSSQSILKEISPGCSLEGLMLKLKLQYFGHLKQRADSLEKTLMLGGIESRRSGRQRMRWSNSNTNMSLSKVREMVKDRDAWSAAVHGVTKNWTRVSEQQQSWARKQWPNTYPDGSTHVIVFHSTNWELLGGGMLLILLRPAGPCPRNQAGCRWVNIWGVVRVPGLLKMRDPRLQS